MTGDWDWGWLAEAGCLGLAGAGWSWLGLAGWELEIGGWGLAWLVALADWAGFATYSSLLQLSLTFSSLLWP